MINMNLINRKFYENEIKKNYTNSVEAAAKFIYVNKKMLQWIV